MILRKFHWILLLNLHLFTSITAQDDKTYDTSEWIPITPSDQPKKQQRAQGRVLNIDAPSQNFFPENDYSGKRPQPQQYIRETVVPKNPNVRLPKAEQPYKYEPVVPLQPPQYIQQTQFVQQPHLVQPQLPFVQPQISEQLIAPPANTPNFYDTSKTQQVQHYHIQPVNSTYFKATNVGSLNQELLGAIQHQNIQTIPITTTTTTTKPKEEKETVQLLYVPLENLKANPPITQQQNYQQRQTISPQVTQQLTNLRVNQQINQQPIALRQTQTQVPRREKQVSRLQNHRLNHLTNIQDDFISQALAAHKLQQQLQNGQPLLIQTTTTTTTTPKPKKRKPNQPPLAVFMEKEGAADVKDVLDVLKQAKSISVQDSVSPNSPQVFVGPSTLDPEGYTKFPLPYLSSVQGNRIERKVEQLPFFVAPLSYKTPEGYSKIPLPSPHVGSVVVSNKEQLHNKNPDVKQPQAAGSAQNQIVQDFNIDRPFELNPYSINQNIPQTTPNTIPGFGNDFLDKFTNLGLQGNYDVSSQKRYPNDYQDNTRDERPQQSYQQTPSKNFITNYQLGLTDSPPQVYETTANYEREEKIKPIYQSPDYQVNDRELPNQNSKELIRDYDIPSVPVESKTTFTPNYQLEEKPEVNQLRDYVTPKTQPNLFNFNEESRITTTTTVKPVSVITQDQFVAQTPRNDYRNQEYNPRVTSQVDPYGQVINQYEIEQINNQFTEGKTEPVPIAPIRTTTPAVISTHRYTNYDTPSTVRSRSRSRQRGRKTTTTTTSTTPNILEDENYTILEEFALQQKPSTPKYTTEVETIPAKVYKLEPEQVPETVPEKVYKYEPEPQLQSQPQRPEVLPDNVYKLEPQPPRSLPDPTFNYEFQPQAQPQPQPSPNKVYQLEPQPQPQPPQPVYTKNEPVQHQHVLNQQTLDHQILRSRPTLAQESPVPDVQEPRVTPLVQNRGQYQQQEEEVPQSNPDLPGLINNLQDQAVRHLLVPNLLVPTTEKSSSSPLQIATEEPQVIYTTTTTTTTEAPTTSQRRSRGRQRAHTRYSSSTSAPRRNVSRRRPTYTRPTTERTTTEASNYEPTRRVSSQRQRFRTRGRPAAREQATERVIQTTENVFKQPPLEGGFQASSGDPQSYMKFDNVVENQQTITIKPEQLNEETPMKEYHQIYSLPSQTQPTERIQEIVTTPKPVVDVKITHSATDRIQEPLVVTTPSSEDSPRYIRINSNIQSGGVYNNRNNDVTRAPTRARVRSRTRSRFSSTTPRTTTSTTIRTTTSTLKPQEEEEEEFYGFIRKPSFSKPAPVIQTTQPPALPLYSASYQETPKMIIQLEDDGADTPQIQNYETNPVQFVGEIRPKYTTTEAQEPSTEAPRVRQRARIRVPSRKPTQQQQQSYNELKSHRFDDQVTRRSSVVRTRSRGKTHFKSPETPTTKNDEYDVVGGNYPAPYLKQLTTEKPSGFQITVDPPEGDVDEDQVPHSSLYSPQIIKTTDTEWVEASVFPSPNVIEMEDKQMFAASSEETTTFENTEFEEGRTETAQPEEETIITTEAIETTTPKRRKMGRRRGVWKLVKQKPVDSFETAESQNYFAVLNAFDEITKQDKIYEHKTQASVPSTESTTTTIEPTTTSSTTTTTTSSPVTKKRRTTTTTTEASIFETLYSMLGLASKASQGYDSKTKISFQKTNKPKVTTPKEEITTTTASPTFPEEITEQTTTEEIKQTEENHNEETTTDLPTTTITTEATVKNYDLEPWSTHEIRTSTSTEVSHETEICFKGKCVKSKDDDDTRL